MIKNQNKYIFTTIISIMILVSCLAMINSSHASENITINNDTHGGIKQAINDTNNTIYLETGTYSGENNTNIIIDKKITIIGNGSDVIINGEKQNRIFNITTNGSLTLINITFINGFSTDGFGGSIYSIGSLNIKNCSFLNNIATISGGAIYNEGIGMIIANCIFANNTATNFTRTGSGSAISNNGDNIIIDNCIFINNTAIGIMEGGAGGTIYNSGNNTTVANSTFTNNTAPRAYGGAICDYSNGIITVTNCTFTNNQATHGGAIDIYYSGKLIVTDSTFINNKATGEGGAISGHVNSTNCTFINNTATSGGAICNGGSIVIVNSTFTNNNATNGGAILNRNDNISITNSTFTKNTATRGGAIHNSGEGMIIANSTFTNNIATTNGGGIHNTGTININDSVFINNIANGVYNAFYNGNSLSTINQNNVSIINDKLNTLIVIDNITCEYDDIILLSAILKDIKNNLIINQVILFYINGNYVGCNITNSEGVAVFYYNIKNIGNLTWGASFEGNEKFTESNNSAKLTVEEIPLLNTTLSITTNTNNNYINLTITLKDSLNNYLSNKLIHLYVNGVNIANLTTNNGMINFSYTANSTGTYNFNAIFEGDESYNSINNLTSIQINSTNNNNGTNNTNETPEKQNTTITMNNFNGTHNKIITLSATLKSENNLISNKLIKFYVNGNFVGEGRTNSQGITTYNYLPNSIGILELKAVFDGDSNYTSSNATSILSITNEVENNTNNQTNPNNTTNNMSLPKQNTYITMNDFKGTYNKIVTISATLKSENTPISNKLINFYANNKYVGQARTNSQGIATFNYKVTSTGTLSIKTMLNEDSSYINSSKTSNLIVPKLSELNMKNVASVKKKTAKITTTIANLGYNKGTFKLTFKLAKGLTYKKPVVSTGKISYNKKTRTLTWTITNLKVHKTKSASITWTLKAKKGKYAMKPSLVKNSSIRVLSNNNLSFRVK